MSKSKKRVKKVALQGPELKVSKKHIMAFPDERLIWFQNGVFNEWYIGTDPFPEPEGTPPNETLNFDKDEQMLDRLLKLQKEYGIVVLSHLWSIYGVVRTRDAGLPVPTVQEDWDLIMDWAKSYEEEDVDRVAHLFGYVYYAMVSEENYEDTLLGKKLKMLGIYQTLVEGLSPQKAACWSRCTSSELLLGSPDMRRAHRLDLECRRRGIV